MKEKNSLFISEKSDKNNEWVTVYTFYNPTNSLSSVIFVVILMHLITATMLLLLIYIFKHIFPTELLKMAASLIRNKQHPSHVLPDEIQTHVDNLSLRIQQLIHEKTIMLSSLSHDMKNMLTNLYLLSSMVSDEEISHQLSQQLDEVQMIIDSSLAFSEGENTKNTQKFNLTDLLINLEIDLIDKGYDFEFKISLPENCYLNGYPSLLKRALINLVNNARKYAGKFQLNASLTENRIIMSIIDNGPGIDPSEITKVISPFYRSEKVLRSNIEGNGLGMAIASTAVKFHQGELEINNRDSGGLEVIITLYQSKNL
ncbi:MAG: signal transduction histidine kinase [Francisellaceae bacterium]